MSLLLYLSDLNVSNRSSFSAALCSQTEAHVSVHHVRELCVCLQNVTKLYELTSVPLLDIPTELRELIVVTHNPQQNLRK